jgi:thymidylate kinase
MYKFEQQKNLVAGSNMILELGALNIPYCTAQYDMPIGLSERGMEFIYEIERFMIAPQLQFETVKLPVHWCNSRYDMIAQLSKTYNLMIDGTVGAGKTTLCKKLQENQANVVVAFEPTDIWLKLLIDPRHKDDSYASKQQLKFHHSKYATAVTTGQVYVEELRRGESMILDRSFILSQIMFGVLNDSGKDVEDAQIQFTEHVTALNGKSWLNIFLLQPVDRTLEVLKQRNQPNDAKFTRRDIIRQLTRGLWAMAIYNKVWPAYCTGVSNDFVEEIPKIEALFQPVYKDTLDDTSKPLFEVEDIFQLHPTRLTRNRSIDESDDATASEVEEPVK